MRIKVPKNWKCKTIKVKMKHTRIINRFLKKIEAAHKATDNSTQVF